MGSKPKELSDHVTPSRTDYHLECQVRHRQPRRTTVGCIVRGCRNPALWLPVLAEIEKRTGVNVAPKVAPNRAGLSEGIRGFGQLQYRRLCEMDRSCRSGVSCVTLPKLVFIHIGKTAGTSLRATLTKAFGRSEEH